METNIEDIRAFALSLQGVTEDMPFGDDNVVFRIGGKIFLCLSLAADNPHFALKLLPGRNEELREQHADITPAYHWNKKHWSDVFYERDFAPDTINRLIEESYLLVLHQLPKKTREEISRLSHPLP